MARFNRRAFSFVLLAGIAVVGLGQACAKFNMSGDASTALSSSSSKGITLSFAASKEAFVASQGGYHVYYGPATGFSLSAGSQRIDVPGSQASSGVVSLKLPISAGTGIYKTVVQAYYVRNGAESTSAASQTATIDMSTATPKLTLAKAFSTSAQNMKLLAAQKFLSKPALSEIDDHVRLLLDNGDFPEGEILVTTAFEPPHIVYNAPGESVAQALKKALGDPAVVSAQPNYVYKTNALPNDPDVAMLWGMRNTGQTIAYTNNNPDVMTVNNANASINPGTSGYDLNSSLAWDVRTDCSSTVVAVVDTGMDYTHTDLKNNLWNGNSKHGASFVTGVTDPKDDNGHGTHVSGTIGAEGNNGFGGVGVCWKAQIMAVKVMDKTGSGTSVAIATGIRYAADNGAKVINMSLGGPGFDFAIEQAIEYALGKDVLVVVAAGNDGNSNDDPDLFDYPCSSTLPNVLCVGAIDQKGALADFSNYGTSSVDVAAPGVNIYSTWMSKDVSMPVATTAGWTNQVGTQWAQNRAVGTSTYKAIAFPANWDLSVKYANSVIGSTSIALPKSSALAQIDQSYINVVANIGLAPADSSSVAGDIIGFRVRADNMSAYGVAGTDASINMGVSINSGFNTPANGLTQVRLDMTKTTCFTTTCFFGMQASTDATSVGTGIGVVQITNVQREFRDDQHTVIAGTSMATPHVTGVAALVASQNPGYSSADIKSAIMGSVKVSTGLSTKIKTSGMVDAFGAVTFVAPPTDLRVTP